MGLWELDDIIDIFSTSPISQYLVKNADNKTIFENERMALDNIYKILETNKQNLSNPLKIVILGEVKAGKSTLVNSLVGKKVSYTNVVEATSSIIEIKYSQEENIFLGQKSNEIKKINSLKELDELMDLNRNKQEFFEDIDKICISTNTERLKEITIVDTPGLHTITDENEERTDGYIGNADVVLWVLNSHHLGQSDVTEKIDDILDYGKPIICIINRIDEVNGNPDSLIDYVKSEMGYMFEEVFAISAKKAWDGQIENNEDKIKKSNISYLYNYLINNVERNSQQIQLESIIESSKIQVDKYIYIHEQSKFKIEELVKRYKKDIAEINKFNNDVKQNVSNKLEEWVDIKLFEEEKQMLLNCTDSSEFENIAREISNDKYIHELISSGYEELNNYILEQWEDYTNRSLSKQISDLKVHLSIDSDEVLIMENRKSNNVTQKPNEKSLKIFKESEVLPIAIVSGLAFSIVSTALAMGAAGGVIGAAIFQAFEGDKEDIERYNKVNFLVGKMKLCMKNDVNKTLISNLNSASDNYFNQSKKLLLFLLHDHNISVEELEDINIKLEKYLYDLKVLRNNTKQFTFASDTKNTDEVMDIEVELDNIMKDLL